MAKFDLKGLLNDRSVPDRQQDQKIVYRNPKDLIPSEENFYNTEKLERLKQSIKLLGILQPLLIENRDGKDYVIAGHCRRKCCIDLLNEGNDRFSRVPCIYKTHSELEQDAGKEDDIVRQIMIIQANCYRDKSDWEKMTETLKMEELVKELREKTPMEGKTRDILKDLIGTSNGQLGRYHAINTRAVNAVGQLMGALTGKSTIVRAKKVNQDYAASLNGTSKGLKNNASNANKAQKEAEKYKRTLLGFDQINKMDDNSSSDTGSGGGADAGALGGIDNMFETTAVQSKFKDLAKLIKDSWKNADFTEVGAIVGRKLNAALQSIPWDEIKNTSNRIAKSIATFLNGFIETTDWGLVGSTLSQGLNTAIGFANTFAQNFHWTSLGKAISDGINGAVKTFDVATAGQTISNVVKGILDSFITAVENTDWQQVGKKVQEFLINIDWKGIVEKLSEAIGAAFGGFAAFLWGLIGDAWKKVVQWWKDTAYKDGQFTISGLFNGIVDALKNVASWIKDHIFKPFINGFKKAFGINSPSTVMIEQGGYIISGLLKGLKDNLPNVLKWVGELPGKVKDKLGNAKEWLKEKGSQAMSGFAAGLHSINIPLPHITVSWNSHTVGPVSFSTPSFGLDWYAKGGFPNMGEMFVARENGPEMVGRMGRRNAVANNNQIVDGIRAGVYEAMVNALESFSGGGNGQNTEVKVYLEGDSKKLFKVIRTEGQDYQKSTGKPVFE